jgi:protein-disulfide isomerase
MQRTSSPSGSGTEASAALTSEGSPTRGNPAAKVHVVEFLDPACETCAQFFPLVERVMADNPDKIRLSVRHVAFHEGSEFAVRVLEASRKQDKYWETLAQLFATQPQWAPQHVAQPDLILQAVAAVGLDQQRLQQDINSPAVSERIARDLKDAMALKVTATPEYFVNGKPLPSFGDTQLLDLIASELRSAY